MGIERLKARNGQSVRNLSALTSDLHRDQYQSVARCARSTNRCLLDSTTIGHCFRSKNDDDTVSNFDHLSYNRQMGNITAEASILQSKIFGESMRR